MEDHLRLNKNSTNKQPRGTSVKATSVQAKHSPDLAAKLKPEKPGFSYSDCHLETAKNVKDIPPKHARNHQKQFIMGVKEDELVKYMSKLPSYLERGQNCQEKLFNVGVLDWSRLEKWQYHHRQIPQRTNRRHSLSSSNPSSSFSVGESSSRGQTCSPSRQRMRRPSLQYHLMSSPMENYPQAVKAFEDNIVKTPDVKHDRINTSNKQGKFIRTDQPHSTNHLEIKMEKCERKYFDPNISPGSVSLANGVNNKSLQQKKAKDNTKTQDGECVKAEDFREQKADSADQDVYQRGERGVVRPPTDVSQGSYSGMPQINEPPTVLGRKVAEESRMSFSDVAEEVGFMAVNSDVPHSCPLLHELDGWSEVKHGSIDSECHSFLPDSSQSVPHPIKRTIIPSRAKNSEVKRSIVMPIDSTLKEPSRAPDQQLSKGTAEKVDKVRSTSPFRRISMGMTKISKGLSSKEVPSLPQSSTCKSATSGSENAMASSCQDTLNAHTQNATSRASSSPLRRLLDPLLKRRVSHCRHSEESSKRDLRPVDKDCKSSNVRLHCSAGTVQPGKENFDVASCRIINVGSPQDIKCESSTFQALLRVAVKNGQPLFTFAVDNERDIIAATMKKLRTPREDDYSCIYTFFSIQEVKKKNGRWINQGSKGKGHDYIPNVVAQLKVFGSQFSNMTGHNLVEHYFAREFVLFAMGLQQSEQQPMEFQPNDELGAIVVKIPKVITKGAMGDDRRIDEFNNFQDSSHKENSQDHPVICSQSLISATVILPSGIHSLPSKGGPSSLIQRWRSGGSCDCGGWDLGCKLRVLVNQNKKSSPSKAHSGLDKFEFITQGAEEENRPVFSLAPFKDGIYSVEFSSSLSILQAFSLCIAVLDSKKLCESSDYSYLFEEKPDVETLITSQNDAIRTQNGAEGEVPPARYVSYPPHSPVGRV